MQSGISASQSLHSAFSSFLSDTSLFALPITIEKESLQPLDPISFGSHSDLNSSLPSLEELLQPKVPLYLLIRRSPGASKFTAVTYVPSTSPVRSKTLFASTRASLVRELGLEKFEDTVFVTDPEEVWDVKQWEERDQSGKGVKGVDVNLLSREERELQSVKRAEEEERHGTGGREMMGMGSNDRGGQGGSSMKMKMTPEARSALEGFTGSSEGGVLVQLGIDLGNETLEFSRQEAAVQAADVKGLVPADKPSYNFYRHPQSVDDGVLFLYVCPGSSKVKERMMYASSRNGVLETAKAMGIVVCKRLEAGDVDELGEQRLNDEAGVGVGVATESASGARSGFARPKRPGKR